MGSYWKSMAAEVLPSWLKSLRARRKQTRMEAPAGQGPDVAPPAGRGDGAAATGVDPDLRPGAGTLEHKER